MFFLLRSAAWLVVLSAIGYFAVFVPIGSRTLWEHVTRIASTEEAQELGREVDSASQRLETVIEGELRERLLESAQGSEAPTDSPDDSAVSPPSTEEQNNDSP